MCDNEEVRPDDGRYNTAKELRLPTTMEVIDLEIREISTRLSALIEAKNFISRFPEAECHFKTLVSRSRFRKIL